MPLPQSSITRINWFLTFICAAISVFIAVPKGDTPINLDVVFITVIILAVFLIPATVSIWLTKRYTNFPYWGFSFLVFWMIPVVLVVMFISLVYRR